MDGTDINVIWNDLMAGDETLFVIISINVADIIFLLSVKFEFQFQCGIKKDPVCMEIGFGSTELSRFDWIFQVNSLIFEWMLCWILW